MRSEHTELLVHHFPINRFTRSITANASPTYTASDLPRTQPQFASRFTALYVRTPSVRRHGMISKVRNWK
jgi:hypothetical protein